MKKLLKVITWPMIIVACLTIGLAPFTPEPHIWGKIKWVIGGGVGMGTVDILDMIMHGLPWMLLILKALSSVLVSRSG